jgi:two-component system sensor histidine kinase KdpD
MPVRLRSAWAGVICAGLGLGLLTAGLAPYLDEANIVDVALVYLLATLVAAAAWGYRVGLVTAVVADLLVNFFFVPPLHTFTVQGPSNVVTLVIFLAVAAIGASMLSLFRREAALAEARRVEAAIMLGLAQQLADAASPAQALDRLCGAIGRALHARGTAVLREDPHWRVAAWSGDRPPLSRSDEALAAEAVRTGQVARVGRAAQTRVQGQPRLSTDPDITFVPFGSPGAEHGVLRIVGPIQVPPLIGGDGLLRAFGHEAGLSLHRLRLAEDAADVEVLRRADEFKSVLLSSVSHDLRSPLTAIKAAVGSLRDPAVAWTLDDRDAFLETVESQTDRLAGTVDNLLEMSRLEGGAVKARIEPVNVLPLLEEVRLATAPICRGRDVEVSAPGVAWVRTDYGLLFQALSNLVENAATYSTAGQPLILSARAEGPVVQVSVRDCGPGIPPEDLPHIFEKFYRGSQAGKTKGTGLGLAIVKAMVELSGGRVSVRSDDSGAEFSLALPATGAPPS